MARHFKWDAWNYDCDGEAYIIAKDECPCAENVPDFICKIDHIHPDCKQDMVVEEGWCKFQVRIDWDNGDGEPRGGYVVEKYPHMTTRFKDKRGWFPVWIVRKDDWY